MNKKKKLKKLTIFFIVIDSLALICLFIFYGPFTNFRDLFVTTAMTTMEHKYLAKTFYSDKVINNILKNNTVKDNGKNSDKSKIVFRRESPTTYESIYEEQVLKRDEGNDLYKIIPVSGSGYKGFLTVIYDSKRISLAMASTYGVEGRQLHSILKENDAIIGINASGFEDVGGIGNGGIATGVVIKDSKIVVAEPNYAHGGGIVGFNKDGVLMLSHNTAYDAIKEGIVDGVQFGPFLVVDGIPSDISGNGGMGVQPRTAIGQRKDGVVLFLVIDGRQPGYSIGASITDVSSILIRYGAYNAANLDGGASTTLAINGSIYNKPCGYENGNLTARMIPNAWIVK